MALLAGHRALGKAPASEHEWLVDNGIRRPFEAGEVVTPKGEKAKCLYIVFSGDIVIRTDRGAGAHKIIGWKAGDAGGVMPYSRGASPPNDSIAEEPSDTLAVPAENLDEMIRECPTITAALVHAMVDRARQFTSSDLRDEKLISLGKLAAGLAHELNNPASAVIRSSKRLTDSLNDAEKAAREMAKAQLTDEQFGLIEKTRNICGVPGGGAPLTSLARADREDAISEWLSEHDADEESTLPLADTSVSIGALDTLAESVTGEALDAAIHWLAACCTVRSLSAEIHTAATRIDQLVSAVKGFSYMDHAPTPEAVDIRRGITDTFTMLGGKTRAKSIDVSISIPADLPKVFTVGAELNQIWMNLIENALDAVSEKGHVSVTAEHELNKVVVNIIDDGPGVPLEIQPRIFDPFFTTKGVGKGTGLGLDTVRRLLQRHEGEISLDSKPGRTEFQVRLPIEK
ncbi:MAG: ATP-binding protein [Gemmatimonadales bacterium]